MLRSSSCNVFLSSTSISSPPGSVLKLPLRKFNVIRHPPLPKSLENVHTNSMLANLCGEALGRVMCSVMFPPLSAPGYPPPTRAAPWLDLYRVQMLLFLMFVLSDSGILSRRGGGEGAKPAGL